MKRILTHWRYGLTALIAYYLGGTTVMAYLINSFNHGISPENLPEILNWPWIILQEIWRT